MAKLDLGKRRAETSLEPLQLDLDGHSWELPGLITMATLRSLATLSTTRDPEAVMVLLDGVMKDLFGDQAEEASHFVGPPDLNLIFEHYGVSMGESSASTAT